MKISKTVNRCDLCFESTAEIVDRYGRKVCKPCFDDTLYDRDDVMDMGD